MKLHSQLWPTEFTPEDLSKPTQRILLLHGMGGIGRLWRPLAAGLEQTWQILAPDQRGHGKSRVVWDGHPGHEPSFTPLDYGRDLAETLDALDFYPTWVLGHSMGVRSAVALAHLQPDRVQGLILVDLGLSGAAGGGLGTSLAEFLKTLPEEFESRQAARALMEQTCPDPAIAQYLMAVSQKEEDGRITFPFDRSALIQTVYASRDTSVERWLMDFAKSTQKKVVLLRGKDSRVWSHEDYEQERQRLQAIPNIEWQEWENCGHGLPFEQRMRLTQLIQSLGDSS
jgi:pimeloyl-ACP methyl ester carboxylesterase